MIPIRTSVEVQEIPGAVIGLILANVAVFVFQGSLPDDLAKQFIYQNGLLPARLYRSRRGPRTGTGPLQLSAVPDQRFPAR